MGFFATHAGDGEVPKYRLYYLGLSLPGTVPTAIAAGSRTVTPASMYGIETGKTLRVVDTFLSNVAVAPSPATSGTTLTLTTGDGAKLPSGTFYVNIYPVGEDATSTARETCAASISGDVLTIARAGSPRTILAGDNVSLCVAGGGSSTEDVVVTGVTSTQFTATYANPHAQDWTFSVPLPTYWTDFDLDIVWNSHKWLAMPITGSQISHQPDGDSGSFKIGDADGDLWSVLAASNGGELSLAEIYEAGFLTTNKTAVPDEVIQIFTGVVDRCTVGSSGEDAVTVYLMPPLQHNTGFVPFRLITSLVRVT